jgi:methyltransferase (TIGR00027 family)
MTPRSRPSLTARSVAAARRRLRRPAIPSGDPAAEDRLVRAVSRAPALLPGFVRYIADRTRFFDETLLDALGRGVPQVVIVGAGYDGRGLRYRQPGVTYFEVDHPATQVDKRERLARAGADTSGISFVPVDFGHQSVAEALATAGHRADTPTHFLCEGVTPYLPESDLLELLGALAGRAAPGSTLAVDGAQPLHRWPMVGRALFLSARVGTALMGERMVTFMTPEEARELLLGAGWSSVTFRPPRGPFSVVFALASAG